MKKNSCLLAIALILLTFSIGIPRLALATEDTSLHKQPFGTKVKGKFRIGDHTFFVPEEGDWTLVGSGEYRATTTGATQGAMMGQVLLLDVRDKKIVRGISAHSTLEYARTVDWTNEPCKREDTVYKIDARRNLRDQNCVLVNHRVNLLRETKGWLRPAGLWVIENSIVVPQTVMEVQVTRYIPSQFMSVTYFFNPEVDGFRPSAHLGWRDNDWNKDRISKDPKKVKYVENLQDWAKRIMPFYENIFEGKAPLGENFPAAPYPVDSHSSPNH